ncbi:MAG: NDP-sugar synthase [Candidatus Thorarchaeota archaeon]
MILAAGKGERMGSLSEHIPKSLVDITGQTILERLLDSLSAAGVEQFTVGVGWKADMMKDYLTSLDISDIVDVVEVAGYEYGPLRTLINSLRSVEDERFLIVPADFMVDRSIVSGLISAHLYDESPRVMTVAVDPKAEVGAPVYARDDGGVAGIGVTGSEATEVGKCALLLMTNREFIKYCDIGLNSGDTRVVSSINRMIIYNEIVRFVSVEGTWFDIDRQSDIHRVNQYLLRERIEHSGNTIFVPENDTIEVTSRLSLAADIIMEEGVQLVGPVLISRNSRIAKGSSLGPNVSVGVGSSIGEECQIRNCVLFGDAEVQANRTLDNFIVYGRHVIKEDD